MMAIYKNRLIEALSDPPIQPGTRVGVRGAGDGVVIIVLDPPGRTPGGRYKVRLDDGRKITISGGELKVLPVPTPNPKPLKKGERRPPPVEESCPHCGSGPPPVEESCPHCGSVAPTWQPDNRKCDGCGFVREGITFAEWLSAQ